MKWVVSGKWKIDGKAGNLTLDAKDMREAIALAGEQGLDGMEAVNVGGTSAAQVQYLKQFTNSVPEEAYGLTRRMAGWAIVGGLLLSPALFGVPLVIWGFVALMKMNRIRAAAGSSPQSILKTPLT